MSRRGPSLVGAAVGFGVAGLGFGSVVGLWFGVQQERLAKRVLQSEAEREVIERVGFLFTYAGVHTGLLLGLLAGAFAGIAYALARRPGGTGPPGNGAFTSGG